MKVPERLWRIQYKITSTCSICKLFKSILFKGKGRHNYFYACFQKICHHVNFFLVQNDFTVMTTRHRHGIFGSATASSKSQVRVATIFILPSFHIHIQQYYEFGNNWIVRPNQDLSQKHLRSYSYYVHKKSAHFHFHESGNSSLPNEINWRKWGQPGWSHSTGSP